MAKRRRSSTERDRAEPVYAPAALTFDQLEGLGDLLSIDWGIDEDDEEFSALRRVMSDPARIDAQLRKMPALGLLVCELLVEAGGVAKATSVAFVLRERTGLDQAAIARFLNDFEGDGVLSVVMQIDRPAEKAYALLSPAAELVGERVWLLSAPASPVPEELLRVEDAPPTDRAAMLAVAGLALHEPIKHTMSGAPHGTNMKKHARRLAMRESAFETLVGEAASTGALRCQDSGTYVPDPARMAALAAGRGVHGAVANSVHGWLAGGPKPADVVLRALVRHRAAQQSHSFLHSMWYREPLERTILIARDQLAEIPGLRRLEVGGVAWLARAHVGSELPAQAEGFVTPNLEVMIGPDPDPRIVARLALCAELVRIDRVLTFRLRPKTVGRGVLSGVSGEELVDLLARIGRHGLPDAVRAQVLDWSAGARVASAQPMTVVRFSPRLHDEVLAALGELASLAPAPGVVIVAAGEPFERLQSLLAAAGVEVSGAAAPGLAQDAPQPSDAGDEPPPLPLVSRADPALRQKIIDERTSGFAPSLVSIAQNAEQASEPGPPIISIDWKAIIVRARAAPPDVRRAVLALAELHASAGREVDEWLDRQAPSIRACIDVVSAMSLVMVPAQHRRRLLASGAPALEVIREANAILARGWASPAGKKVVAAMRDVDPDALYRFVRGVSDGEGARPPEHAPLPSRGELIAGLRDLNKLDVPVQLGWEAADGMKTALVWIDELRTRGKEPVVLVTEVDTERARVLPLSSVRSVELG